MAIHLAGKMLFPVDDAASRGAVHQRQQVGDPGLLFEIERTTGGSSESVIARLIFLAMDFGILQQTDDVVLVVVRLDIFLVGSCRLMTEPPAPE
jgi:hypothetical protein